MKVYFVGAGPGDPELLTRKAERLLRQGQFCIYAGSLVNPQILELLPKSAERHDSAPLSLDQIIELVLRARKRDLDVLRLHTGDPSIYGAIGEQMRELDARGIDYSVVPGVSSFQAAAASLAVELTAPEVAQTVILTRSSGRTPLPDSQRLEKLAQSQATLCIFLSVHKLHEVCRTLSASYGPDCSAAVVYRASWPDQQLFRGTLGDIAGQVDAANIRKTAMILVGPALAGAPINSKLYDKQFSHAHRRARSS